MGVTIKIMIVHHAVHITEHTSFVIHADYHPMNQTPYPVQLLKQGPTLAEVHLDMKMAPFLPCTVLRDDVWVEWQCCYGAHFSQAPLSLELGPETPPQPLHRKQLVGGPMTNAKHLAVGCLADQPQKLKVVVVLKQVRVDNAVRSASFRHHKHLHQVIQGRAEFTNAGNTASSCTLSNQIILVSGPIL